MFREKNSRIARAGLDPGISELQSSPPKPPKTLNHGGFAIYWGRGGGGGGVDLNLYGNNPNPANRSSKFRSQCKWSLIRLETLFQLKNVVPFLLGCLCYKLGSVFPSGTNRTLACSARAQDISVCVECVE